MEGPGLTRDPHEEEGGSHRPGASGLCWERQWEQAIAYMRQRWGQHNRWDPGSYYWFGSNVSGAAGGWSSMACTGGVLVVECAAAGLRWVLAPGSNVGQGRDTCDAS